MQFQRMKIELPMLALQALFIVFALLINIVLGVTWLVLISFGLYVRYSDSKFAIRSRQISNM